jgi:hypothetical protein
MKKIIIFAAAFLLIIILVMYLIIPRGAKYADYAFLAEPRITSMPDEQVIEVKSTGDPAKTTQTAFNLLFKTYYKISGVNKMKMPAPKARWYIEKDSSRDSWEGHFAISVPGGVAIPEIADGAGLKVELVKWTYGGVAEILHVGPYNMEVPTINKLLKFIEDSGYDIVGPHEEEYIKGPMPLLPSNPEKYLTIIRYQVKKK